jgi:hypothetical protein
VIRTNCLFFCPKVCLRSNAKFAQQLDDLTITHEIREISRERGLSDGDIERFVERRRDLIWFQDVPFYRFSW